MGEGKGKTKETVNDRFNAALKGITMTGNLWVQPAARGVPVQGGPSKGGGKRCRWNQRKI